jgi:hypothetical protein
VAQVPETLIQLAEHIGGGHPNVGEGQLGGVLHLAAHLVEFATAGEAGHAVLDDQQREPSPPVVRVCRGTGHDDDKVGLHAAGDESLCAVDDIVVAVTHRVRAHAGQIGAGAGLGHRDGAEQLPGSQAGEPPLTLLGIRVVQEVRQDDLELVCAPSRA